MFENVKIYYGPCRSLNDIMYRPRKLKGLRVALQKLGYRVDFVPVKWQDYCMIEMGGHEVFRCNIQNFKFNTCVERDPVAQRAIQAVLNGTTRCLRARRFLWNYEMLDNCIVSQSEFGPKDYFLPTINIEPLEDFKQKLQSSEKQEEQAEERFEDDDSSEGDESLLPSLLSAPQTSSNKDNDENNGVDYDIIVLGDNNIEVGNDKDNVNDDVCNSEHDNDVDDVDEALNGH